MALLAGLGRVVSGIGSSRAGLAALGVGAAGLGAAQEISGGAVDAAMDVAFGAPDADKYFVGRELNSRYLIGRGIGGPLGSAMQATDPGAGFTFSGGAGTPGATATMAGAGIGTIGGAVGGAYAASKYAAYKSKGGLRAKINSAIVGAAIGGGVLGGAPLAMTGNMIRQNPEFFNETAYGRSTSSNTAAGLNAVGDIVLGMHNARGGY